MTKTERATPDDDTGALPLDSDLAAIAERWLAHLQHERAQAELTLTAYRRDLDQFARRHAIHIIVDNLSAHKTQKVRTFLAAHPTVRLHYTPTYSSWLNQVELWFSKIERDVINRGIFKSVKDLSRKIMTYIRHYNDNAKPMKWSYRDPTHRIRSTTSNVIGTSN